MEKNIYVGKGSEEYYDEYIDFINYVFGFNGNANDFKKLLPKLYKPEYNPVENSYVVVENGRLRAAVGAYDLKYKILDEIVKIRGIGNVAVHPYSRSKGYMKALMNAAVSDMITDGIDLSILGGRRQRYNYFGYDKLGTTYAFSLVDDNMRHSFGKERTSKFVYKRVTPDDPKTLMFIKDLIDSQPCAPLRSLEKLYDTLVSWKKTLYAAFDCEDRFIGYCVYGDKSIDEILVLNDGDIVDFIVGFYDFIGSSSLVVRLPEWKRSYISKLCRLCESYNVEMNKSFSVFNYEKILRSLLKLKSTYTSLPDGELCVLIHGAARDEKLLIKVKDGVPAVMQADGEQTADKELLHLDAMNFFFATVAPERDSMPYFIRVWLPLPLWIYSADNV